MTGGGLLEQERFLAHCRALPPPGASRHPPHKGEGWERLRRVVDLQHTAADLIFLDLPGLAGILVDRDADLAVGAGQRPREQAGGAALDVEKPDLAEIEQSFVEAGPDIHAAAMDVVGEMVEIEQPGAFGPRISV